MSAHACLTAIVLCFFRASAVFGRVTVSTPFLQLASILSASTPSGTRNERWNAPLVTLGEEVVLLLVLLVFFFLSLDRQRAVRELDFDILLVCPRQLGRELVALVLLDDIDGRYCTKTDPTAPVWFDIVSPRPCDMPGND